jgi:hypothetical protein
MLFLLLTQLAVAAFQPNDISILLPLPKRGEEVKLWGPESGDVLLPGAVFTKLPDIVLDLDKGTVYKTALKVVAIRVDPCFREENTHCRRMIRLVWQPLVFEENRFTSLDAAIHTFYELNEGQWLSFLRELPAGAPGAKLSIHPQLAKEGYAGATWQKLQAILKYCNPVTLVRATAMTVNPLGNIWFFSGVEVKSGATAPIRIPRVNDFTQGFFANVSDLDSPEFRVAMDPAPQDQPAFLRVLRDSVSARRMADSDLQDATRESLRLENPELTHPGNVDCASCHSARLASSWAARSFPGWDWLNLFEREIFFDSGKAILPEPKTTPANVLRMYGYFEDEPVIARRVEFETIQSLKAF